MVFNNLKNAFANTENIFSGATDRLTGGLKEMLGGSGSSDNIISLNSSSEESLVVDTGTLARPILEKQLCGIGTMSDSFC
ncbi:MAG: hypothetical protein ABIH39_04015 [Candidatus Margulisiibacteriota bacterium]